MQVVHNYKVFPLTKTPSCMVTGMQPKAVEGNLGQDNLGQGKHIPAWEGSLGEGSLAVGSLAEGSLGQGSLAVGSLAGAGEGRQQTSRKVEVELA